MSKVYVDIFKVQNIFLKNIFSDPIPPKIFVRNDPLSILKAFWGPWGT